MDGWSSFANDKKIADKWRQFLTEAPIAGINSDVYPDSLTNMLQPMVDQGIITIDEKEELINLMLQLTADDNIVLEALGGPSRDPRTFSDASTRALNDLIRSLGLKPDMRKRLEGVLDQWARVNTVNFSQTDPGIGLDTSELPPPAIPKPDITMPLPPPDIGPPIDDEEEEEEEITTTGGDDEEEEITTTGGDDEEEEITTTGGDDEEEITSLTKTGTGDDEEEEEDGVEVGEDWALDLVQATLDITGAIGLYPPAEIVATPATLASLLLNLYRAKLGWALLDVIALVPWAGKLAKAGKVGKMAQTFATSSKTGRALIKVFGSAAKSRKAIEMSAKAMKAYKGSKGMAGVKTLYENVPEEYIREAVYSKTDEGDYYIDSLLDFLDHVPHPVVKSSVGALKATIAWIRQDLGPDEETGGREITVFSDLVYLSDADVKRLLKKIKPDDLVKALATGETEDEAVRAHFMDSLTNAEAKRLETDTSFPVIQEPSISEPAQRRIVKKAKALGSKMNETYNRWQIIAGINKRVL